MSKNNEGSSIVVYNALSRTTDEFEVVVQHQDAIVSLHPLKAQLLVRRLGESIQKNIADESMVIDYLVSHVKIGISIQQSLLLLVNLSQAACNAQTLNQVRAYFVNELDMPNEMSREFLLAIRSYEARMAENPDYWQNDPESPQS